MLSLHGFSMATVLVEALYPTKGRLRFTVLLRIYIPQQSDGYLGT